MAHANNALNAIHDLCMKAMGAMSIAEMTDLALDGVMTAIAPDLVFLYGVAQGSLVLQGVRPSGHIELPENKRIGECLCGLAAQEMKPIFSLNIHSDDRCTLPECKAARVHSLASLPLLGEDELIGVLCLASMTARDFAAQKSFLETLAATVALTLKKALLFHQLEQQRLTLEGRLTDSTAELAIRNTELERLKKIFVDREFRIKALRVKLDALTKKS